MTPQDLLHVLVADALGAAPWRARVFVEHGMACVGCPMARFETIEEVAAAYGLNALSFAAALTGAALPSAPTPPGTLE